MLPKVFNTILRVAGLLITIILLVQPWLIAAPSADPFLYSGWAQFVSAFISLLFSSILLAMYRPQKGYITLNAGLLILFFAISLALYNSPYNICFRASLLAIGFIANIGALRILRKQQDNFSVGGMISLCGLSMAIYAISQAMGNDFLSWSGKQSIVGTLTNSNFLGIFLCLTSAITFGMFTEIVSKSKKHGFTFLAFFLVQLAVIVMLHKPGHIICLVFMAILWVWSRWFKVSGKISKRTPIIAGLLLTIIILASQWMVYRGISNYDWKKITKVSTNDQTAVSRFILWQMGFEIFLSHLKTGAGVGSVAYIMPLKRPPTGSTLGINIYNDDPHSFIITTLAEIGIPGLLGICIILASIYGCYLRKNTKYESVEILENSANNELPQKEESQNNDASNIDNTEQAENNENQKENSQGNEVQASPNCPEFPWLYTFIAVVILYFGFQSGFILKRYLPVAISTIIAFFGILTTLTNNSYVSTPNDYRYLGRSTLVAISTFVFYSLFNNSFSILPLIVFATMLVSLHYSCCQPDVRWKPRMTFVSLLFIALPIIYGIAAYNVQINYQQEQTLLCAATEAYNERNWQEAETNFRNVIKLNSQQLNAYHGLAMSLYYQKKYEEAQETLLLLDSMVPNIFNSKLEIANILLENKKILEAHRFAVQNLEWAENPLAYEMLGKILLVEGRINEAEKIFNESLISIPANTQERLAADRIRLRLAALTSNRGDFKTSKIHIESIHSEVAQTIDALYIKGMLLTREKKYEKALQVFNQALESYPHVPRILNAIGYILLITNKDLERAQILLEEAYQLVRNSEQPDLADLLSITNSLGKLYLKQNKLKEAGELLKLSYEGTPNEWKTLKEERLQALNDFYNSFSEAQ